jgi:hypothetical protein
MESLDTRRRMMTLAIRVRLGGSVYQANLSRQRNILRNLG